MPRRALLILVLSLGSGCSAAPTNHTLITQQPASYVGYVKDPDGRGTLSLVFSCLLTLILCVWSALHLNVPPHKQSNAQCIWTNIRWIFVGIYAPELVCFVAWRQWSSAKILNRSVQECLSAGGTIVGTSANTKEPQHEAGNSTTTRALPYAQRKHAWSKTHSFFASTGGFALESSPRSKSAELLPAGCPKRLSLTARGVQLLAECGHLPDVAEEDLLDKSKANGMAKALVIAQALWMLLQVVGRVAVQLPVTLLEVNTVAHVLCALLMYCLWWHKPLLPSEPIVISSAALDPLFAYMFMCSEISGEGSPELIENHTTVKQLFAAMKIYSKTPEIEGFCLVPRDQHALPASPTLLQAQDSLVERKLLSRSSTQCLKYRESLRRAGGNDLAFFERRPRIKAREMEANGGSEAQAVRNRTEAVADAMAAYPMLLSKCRTAHPSQNCVHVESEEYIVARVRNWPSEDLLRESSGLVVGMILWTSNLIYGAIHAAAWNDHFPSTAERWLWRASAVYISFAGGLWIILNGISYMYPALNEWWERWMNGEKSWWHYLLIGTPVIICGSSFILARMYVLLEAFISIRELPLAAYSTPSWSQIFPHF